MNTILQKRIEEAANITVQNLYNYARQARNPKVSAYSGDYLDAIYIQGEFVFKEGANYALSNQWISVEEALPELDNHGYSKPVLVMNDINELLVATYSKNYDKWNAVGPISYHRLVITHWMLIPELKGSKK